MGSTPSPPAAPDPIATASAQTGQDVTTAEANAALANMNQTDPYGNTIKYNVDGSTTLTGPNGQVYNVPKYSETTAFGPQEQQIANLDLGTQKNLAEIGQSESSKIGDLLNTPFSLDANTINKFTNTQWEQPFEVSAGQQQDKLTQQLADEGIHLNDPGYNTAEYNLGQNIQGQQDTYDTNMYGQAVQAALTQRNQPINEIDALLSGSQVGQPNFTGVNTAAGAIPTTNVSQDIQNSYQDAMQGYNAQVANSSATTGGLFGLGGSIAGGLLRMAPMAALA